MFTDVCNKKQYSFFKFTLVIFSSNKALADSLDMAEDPGDPLVNKLLRSMATQAMSNALYFSTGSCSEDLFYHYGKQYYIFFCQIVE